MSWLFIVEHSYLALMSSSFLNHKIPSQSLLRSPLTSPDPSPLCGLLRRVEKLRLKVKLFGKDPVIDSLVPVWPGANWLEREIFDLFGIQFSGHPDLRRIVLPDDWEGHPLRRDYPVEGFRDIPVMPLGFTKRSV